MKLVLSGFAAAFGLLLVALSAVPLWAMIREDDIEYSLQRRYAIEHADSSQGFPSVLQSSEITVEGLRIRIVERPTGKLAPLTWWDRKEGVPAGEIVEASVELNGVEIAQPSEIWLSNRNNGGKYYSWIDVLTIEDRDTGAVEAAVVQRLTDDDARPEDRQWRIVRITRDGRWKEETLAYRDRADNPLGVKLVTMSGTSQIAMGYRSDITTGIPNLVFPVLFPGATMLLGLAMAVIGSVVSALAYRRRRRTNRPPGSLA